MFFVDLLCLNVYVQTINIYAMQFHYGNISLLRLDITRDAFLVFRNTIRQIKGMRLK